MKNTFKSLSKEEYDKLKEMGFLWEFYPTATGDYKTDMEK